MKRLKRICWVLFLTTLIFSSCGSEDKKNDLSKVKMVFDIPSLLDYDIDEVRMVYAMSALEQGAEPTKEQMKLEPKSWDDICERGELLLLITYNPKNRKVLEYFIATGTPGGLTDDYLDLLKICNVKKGDKRYSIVPVIATNDRYKFTGIRIVLK